MFKGVPFKGLLLSGQENGGRKGRRRFNLQRWFSLVSLLVISLVALGLGTISTRYVVNESITRDALLTAQFVTAIGTAELRHVKFRRCTPWVTFWIPANRSAACPKSPSTSANVPAANSSTISRTCPMPC